MRCAILTLIALYLSIIQCDIHTQCDMCFDNENFQKYCMYSMDGMQGKCCLRNQTTDDCLRDQFTCTDKIPTNYQFHKYALCSFDPINCGTSKRTLFAKETPQTIYTTLEFKLYDSCPYYIYSDTELPFNTRVQLLINKAINVDVYFLLGSSLE